MERTYKLKFACNIDSVHDSILLTLLQMESIQDLKLNCMPLPGTGKEAVLGQFHDCSSSASGVRPTESTAMGSCYFPLLCILKAFRL